jgi:hypothetical protein
MKGSASERTSTRLRAFAAGESIVDVAEMRRRRREEGEAVIGLT